MDYSQTINQYTELDGYLLPRIDDMVNTLAKYKLFSTFDLKSAYHQVPIKESDMNYTGFEANGGSTIFVTSHLVLPMVLLQRAMDKMIEEEGLNDTFPYLDNITVAGKDQEEHNSNVQRFLEAVRLRNLSLNQSKTVESVKSINILGYCGGDGIIKSDTERLHPLQEFPPPTNRYSLCRVVGLFAYYAKWVPQFSDWIRPLMNVASFLLDTAATAAYNLLKKELEKAALQSIDESCLFVVECDASAVAISGNAKSRGGRPVAFMSRTLQNSALHYPSVEKEAAAIIEAVRKWRHLLASQHFTLVTDQRSVAFILDNQKCSKVKNNKIQVWILELASFCYTVKYRPGKDNVALDSFTCASLSAIPASDLDDIHKALCHPGVTWMYTLYGQRICHTRLMM